MLHIVTIFVAVLLNLLEIVIHGIIGRSLLFFEQITFLLACHHRWFRLVIDITTTHFLRFVQIVKTVCISIVFKATL